MKVLCPKCRHELPVENISLGSGWCKCADCNEVFSLAEVLPGFAVLPGNTVLPGSTLPGSGAMVKAERPFDSWAVVEQTPQRLIVHVPPQGMRASTWGILGFSIFWTAFIAFWTTAALGLLGGGGIQPQNALFASFSTPFWLVGFSLLAAVLWSSRGSRTLYLDSSQAVTELRCLAFRKRRVIDRARVQHARPSHTKPTWQGSQVPPQVTPAIELIFERGSFSIPCNSDAEQAWLLSEINGYLQEVPYLPPSAATREETAWSRH